MKRLKYYLLAMQPNDTTYKEMYEGEMVLPEGINKNGIMDYVYDPTYWNETVAYRIERTNKLELDKPSVTVSIPVERLGIKQECTAGADYVLRAFRPYIDELNESNYNRSRPDRENGKYCIYVPDGVVLERNASSFKMVAQKNYILEKGNQITIPEDRSAIPSERCINILLQVQLPYRKLRKAVQMLTKDLPEAVERFICAFDPGEYQKAVLLSQTQEAIRSWLRESCYCCFIADGSILPRSKGSSLPLVHAVTFQSPPEAAIEVCGVRGMGIKRGVTVITGGGYSGKSTMLDAISAGVYNHIAGDGRELVITDNSAMKISAEDGRSVKNVNISPFIRWLPSGNTKNFTTEHASGSTSQAANIMEAINFGAKLLLIDEDKSATNFMIRDNMMKELIRKEPIIPFTDRVRELYEIAGVSTILVIGGSGEYLSEADRIYMMQDYHLLDSTKQAKDICRHCNADKKAVSEGIAAATWKDSRKLMAKSFTPYPEESGSERLQVSDMGFIFIGEERIDIRMLHNLVSDAQQNAVGFILRKLELESKTIRIDIGQAVEDMLTRLNKEGLESAFSTYFTNTLRWLDMPRKNEILSVINRMRFVDFVKDESQLL